MNDALKGALILGIWLGLSLIVLQNIETPASGTVACLTPVATLVAAVIIVNLITRPARQSAPPPYPENWDALRAQALSRDGYRCGNCGATSKLHVHHIVPLSRGGTNVLGNLRTLCDSCHKLLHPHMQ